jgi:hypothetical protein
MSTEKQNASRAKADVQGSEALRAGGGFTSHFTTDAESRQSPALAELIQFHELEAGRAAAALAHHVKLCDQLRAQLRHSRAARS